MPCAAAQLGLINKPEQVNHGELTPEVLAILDELAFTEEDLAAAREEAVDFLIGLFDEGPEAIDAYLRADQEGKPAPATKSSLQEIANSLHGKNRTCAPDWSKIAKKEANPGGQISEPADQISEERHRSRIGTRWSKIGNVPSVKNRKASP